MKISVSKAELLRILSEHFSQQVTEIVISKENPAYDDLMKSLGKELAISPFSDKNMMEPNHKIRNIKALRTVIAGLGLFEAKMAVEQWPRWVALFKRTGNAPLNFS